MQGPAHPSALRMTSFRSLIQGNLPATTLKSMNESTIIIPYLMHRKLSAEGQPTFAQF